MIAITCFFNSSLSPLHNNCTFWPWNSIWNNQHIVRHDYIGFCLFSTAHKSVYVTGLNATFRDWQCNRDLHDAQLPSVIRYHHNLCHINTLELLLKNTNTIQKTLYAAVPCWLTCQRSSSKEKTLYRALHLLLPLAFSADKTWNMMMSHWCLCVLIYPDVWPF